MSHREDATSRALPRTNVNWRRVTGLFLVVVGCIGFGTVADDLDHAGEFFSISGILVAGLVLLVAGSRYMMARRLPLHWIPIGIGVGEAIGAVMDKSPEAVLGGAALGAVGATISGLRRRGASLLRSEFPPTPRWR